MLAVYMWVCQRKERNLIDFQNYRLNTGTIFIELCNFIEYCQNVYVRVDYRYDRTQKQLSCCN